MESRVTMFSDGKVLIQDTEKMKTIKNEVVEVIIKEYMTTKENLINVLNVIEKIEQENANKTKVEQENVTTENEKIVTAETINKENIEQNQTETNSTEETKE